MGEPTVHKEVEAAARLGLETFTYASDLQYDSDPEGKLNWWNLMGDYRPATGRFPDDMAALRNHLDEKALELGLWIDPRIGLHNPRVHDPEIRRHLLFYDAAFDAETEGKYNPISYDINIQPLVNLASEGGREWFARQLEKMTADYGAKMIWFDMNCDPRPYFFDPNDPPDRQGLLELGFYQGFETVLAEFRHKHPDVWIEICASGGRMISLASIKAGHSHWITDYTGYDPDIAGAILMGANSILPTGCIHQNWYFPPGTLQPPPLEPEGFPANFPANLSFAPELFVSSEGHLDRLRDQVDLWRDCSHLFKGDFYPLLPPAEDRTGVEAWQIHDSVEGEGLVCLRFLGASDPGPPVSLRLRGLGPNEPTIAGTPYGDATTELSGDTLHIQLHSGRACLCRYRIARARDTSSRSLLPRPSLP